MKKRILSFILAITTLLVTIPATVFPVLAAEEATDTVVLSSTTFAPNQEGTWPIFEDYDVSTMKQNEHVGVTYQGGWEIGYKYVGGNSANFTAYTGLYKAINDPESPMILSSDTSYWTNWGGLYIEGNPYLFFSGVKLEETEGYKTATVTADPTVRYTVKESGTIRINVNELYFYSDLAACFTVYHNGIAVHDPITSDNAKYQIVDGSFVYKTASNMASAFQTVTLDVQKGDSIDFVSHANKDFNASNVGDLGLNQFASNEYAKSKRGIYDYEFKIEYIAEKVSYSSRFAPNEASSFPVFDAYSTSTMKVGDSVGVSYPGAWQFGYRDPAGTAANFTAYDKLFKANDAGHMILSASSDYFAEHGGVYITGIPTLMFSGASYTNDGTSVAAHKADPVIRYTAEYTGTALIRLHELYFYASNTAYFEILHNGVPLTNPHLAAEGQYRAKDGAYASAGAANKGADFGTLVVELKQGDTLDFVSRGNDDFNASNAEELGLSKFDQTEYAYAMRGLLDFDFEITYRSARDGGKTDRYTAVGASVNATLPKPLFVWYDEDGNRLNDGDERQAGIGGPDTSNSTEMVFDSLLSLFDWLYEKGGSYAKINSELFAGGILDASDSYEAVLEKYKAYLATFTSLSFPSGFSAGVRAQSSFTPFNRLCFFENSNLFSVAQANCVASALVNYRYNGSFFATEAQFASALDAFIANAASMQPSGSFAEDLRIEYKQIPDGSEINESGVSAAGAGAAMKYEGESLFLYPAADGIASYTYTVPSGYDRPIFTLSVDDLYFAGEENAFHYAIAVNGKVVWPAGATISSSVADHDAEAGWQLYTGEEDFKATLASLHFEVKGGDVFELCVSRAYKNGENLGEVCVGMDLSAKTDNYHDVCALDVVRLGDYLYRGLHEFNSTVTLSELGLPKTFGANGVYVNNATAAEKLPATLAMIRNYRITDLVLASSVSLSIFSSFAINIYVQAQSGATVAGIVVDGEKIAGVEQGNNVYKCTLPVAPKDLPNMQISYRAYQEKNGSDIVNADATDLSAFDLLSRYEASNDRTTRLLAQTVRHYSLAARDYFVNGHVTLTQDVKNALRGRTNSSTVGEIDTAILGMVDAYKAGVAYQPYPDGTNANEFTFRFHGATLKLDDSLGFVFRVARTDGALFGEPDLRLQVKDKDGEVRYLATPEFLFDEQGKEMVYFVRNLPATEYASEFYFTMVNSKGEAQSATLSYSAHAYIARVFNTANGDDSVTHYLLRGIYALGEAAVAYKEVHSSNYDKDYVCAIGDGGDTLDVNAPVMKEATYDPSAATVLSGAEFLATTPVAGGVYEISGNTMTVRDKSGTVNGNGSILLVSFGLVIDGCNGLTVSNLAIAGPVIVRNSSGVIFENCQILAAGKTAVTVEETADSVVFNACRIIGDTAVVNAADELTVINAYLGFAENGILDAAATGTTVQNCRLFGAGKGTAIRSTASESAFRFNTISLGSVSSVGIELAGDGNMLNVLVAQNVITGTRDSMVIEGVLNASVVLNSAVTATAKNSKNLYIVDNAIGGRLVLENNNYLMADGNLFPHDTMDHTTLSTGNRNTNGDNLMNVDARLDVGANEDLLPHVDKDLFLDMERKESVKDVTSDSKLDVYRYIMTHSQASASHYIVVAPGAYLLKDSDYNGTYGLSLSTDENNGDRIYAYGVYAEHESGLHRHITVDGRSDIQIKGLSIGYAAQSVGQVHVIEKLSSTSFRAVAPAGLTAEHFGVGGGYLHRTGRGEEYIFCDVSFSSVEDNGDGTLTVTLPAAEAELVSVGDSLTKRATGGQLTIGTSSSANILYQDITVFGISSSMCMVESANTGYITYHRILDTNRNGRVIDQDTYEQYEAYGADLVSVDEAGRLRGTKQLIGSVDAIHTLSCVYGSQIISCVFESLCDNGTNQKAYAGRLSSVTDNKDGTTTIHYKSALSTFGGVNCCAPFSVGDRVFIYTAKGQTVCDTAALSATVDLGSHTATEKGVARTFYDYAVTVSTDEVNFDALEDYDLSLDTADNTGKVLIDNRTRASNGFLIDNAIIDGTRSRGLLIKSSDGVIKNCTLRNVAKVGVAVLYEISWGESGVSENLVIENNFFDNVSYSVNNSGHYTHYPIFIKGLSDSNKTDEEFLPYTNITIRGNVFRNRHSETALYVQSAQRVTVYENDFGSMIGETEADPKPSITFNGARDVEISGNTYSPYVTDIGDAYTGTAVKNLHGSDVSKYPFHDENYDLHIRYQDTYTFPVAVAAIENVVITSKVTGTDTMDANLLIIKEDGKSIYADGCGTATVRLVNGERANVIVEASDISLFFVTGQSNASGDHSFSDSSTEDYQKYYHTYADYFIRTAPTMAYFTWTGQSLSLTGSKNPENSVTDTLDWESAGDQSFMDPKVFSAAVGSTGFGNAGWSAALAHEWVEQTGERVWIVNASHGGQGIETFAPSDDGTPIDNNYYQAVAVFNEALKTLYAEVDAGHFTLSHMAYYWFHGCADFLQTEEYYTTGFAKMHTAIQADVVYNHAGAEHKLEYCGLMDIRSKHDSSGNSYAEKYLTGPRLAHYQAANDTKGVFHNVFVASNVTERWLGDDQNVVDYFLETYGSAENFKEIFGYDMPTTRWELHPNVHYLMMGHNEMGMDCARNTLRIINALGVGKTYVHDYEDEDAPTTVTLVARNGHTTFTDSILLERSGSTTVLPMATPTWRTMYGLRLESETDGFVFDGFELTCTDTTKTDIKIAIYLGDTKLETRTLTVKHASFFSNHTPTISGSTVTMQGPWSLGGVSRLNGAYTPYTHMSQDWISSVAGSAHNANGSFLVGTWAASMYWSAMTSAESITYIAEEDGCIAIAAEQFDAATVGGGGVFLAVMVNGKMVWPTKASAPYALPTSTTDTTWKYMADAKDGSGTEQLNELWKDLRLTVSKGALVQFCLISDATREITGGASKTNSQPILHPYITYVD